MNLAPIILFVYNRPWHTEQTLTALMKNNLASESRLYIYCDGPKIEASAEERKKINEVRKTIRKKKWCSEVIIVKREENLGLAESVIQGVSEVIEKHGKVIVLEDDILTGNYFLKFMNNGLNIYQKEDKVFGVSGYCFPHGGRIEDSTYFLPIMSSWGYGTWADRWQKINFDGEDLLEKVELKKIGSNLDFGEIVYYKMLKDFVEGKNDSWAVRFYVSMFFERGVFLFPNISLLENIGFDGSGIHCGFDPLNLYSGEFVNNREIIVEKIRIELKPKILSTLKRRKLQNKSQNGSNHKRLFNNVLLKIRHLLKG